MKTILMVLGIFSHAFALGLVITELYRDPPGKESEMPGGLSHEFIEVTNFGVDTVALNGICFTDGSEADTLVLFDNAQRSVFSDCSTSARVILPGQTLLILDRDYPSTINVAPQSKFTIAAGTVIATTTNSQLCNDLASTDGVVLYKGTRTRIDSVLCNASDQLSMLVPKGSPLTLSSTPEGISAVPFSLLFSNKTYGLSKDSCTPGYFENIKSGLFMEWKFGGDNGNNELPCTLACTPVPFSSKKIGYTLGAQNGFSIKNEFTLYDHAYISVVSIPDTIEELELTVNSGDSLSTWEIHKWQYRDVSQTLKINEIFPRVQSDEPEWLEIVNVSTSIVNLNNWKLADNETVIVLSSSDLLLKPGGFIVFTKDRAMFSRKYPANSKVVQPVTWMTFDNYRDTLQLLSNDSICADKVIYNSIYLPEWTMQSLERVKPANDGTLKDAFVLNDRPTPAQPNNALFWRTVNKLTLDINPIPFTPDNNGHDDLLAITIGLPSGQSGSVAIFGFDGGCIKSFPVLRNQFYWDGKMDNGKYAPSGPFFVVAMVKTSSGNTTIRKKGILWR